MLPGTKTAFYKMIFSEINFLYIAREMVEKNFAKQQFSWEILEEIFTFNLPKIALVDGVRQEWNFLKWYTLYMFRFL